MTVNTVQPKSLSNFFRGWRRLGMGWKGFLGHNHSSLSRKRSRHKQLVSGTKKRKWNSEPERFCLPKSVPRTLISTLSVLGNCNTLGHELPPQNPSNKSGTQKGESHFSSPSTHHYPVQHPESSATNTNQSAVQQVTYSTWDSTQRGHASVTRATATSRPNILPSEPQK